MAEGVISSAYWARKNEVQEKVVESARVDVVMLP